MKAYRISFFNDLPNSFGHVFHCCQQIVEIRAAKSKDRAIEAAKHHFARKERIPHWHLHAHSIEIQEIASGGKSAKHPSDHVH